MLVSGMTASLALLCAGTGHDEGDTQSMRGASSESDEESVQRCIHGSVRSQNVHRGCDAYTLCHRGPNT